MRLPQSNHGHIEYHVTEDYTYQVVNSHLRRLFYQRHHQDRKGYEHTAYNLIIGLITVAFPLYMTIVIAFKQPSEMTNSISGMDQREGQRLEL